MSWKLNGPKNLCSWALILAGRLSRYHLCWIMTQHDLCSAVISESLYVITYITKTILDGVLGLNLWRHVRRMSETPTTTTSQKVWQYTSNLHIQYFSPICIFSTSLPFVLQCATHSYRNTFVGAILVVGVTGRTVRMQAGALVFNWIVILLLKVITFIVSS